MAAHAQPPPGYTASASAAHERTELAAEERCERANERMVITLSVACTAVGIFDLLLLAFGL